MRAREAWPVLLCSLLLLISHVAGLLNCFDYFDEISCNGALAEQCRRCRWTSGEGCDEAFILPGEECDDLNDCTEDDVCQAGNVCSGTEIICGACQTCSEGSCVPDAAATCSDGLGCTLDTCVQGSCVSEFQCDATSCPCGAPQTCDLAAMTCQCPATACSPECGGTCADETLQCDKASGLCVAAPATGPDLASVAVVTGLVVVGGIGAALAVRRQMQEQESREKRTDQQNAKFEARMKAKRKREDARRHNPHV